jgi:ribosomal protein L37AE/L43A
VIEAECIECGDDFSIRRYKLGYFTCLDCGENHARIEAQRKSKCSAPAYNKGAYMYVSSKSMAKDLGR